MKPKGPKNSAETHREWLELVDTDGPFLAVPPLKRVYPQGIPQPDADALAVLKDAKPAFESAWEKWDSYRDDEAALDAYRDAREAWVETVLRDVIGWNEDYTTAVSEPTVTSPNHAVTVCPSGALVHGETTGALVLVIDPVDSLRDPADDGWAASPIDRMEEMLRTAGIPIGVVTDGRWWAIVSAREQTMVASGIVDAQTWVEEPATRNAVIELLSRKRLVGGEAKNRLTELFGESVAAAEEITEALGREVRRAVELLVRALSEAGTDALPERRAEVYEAAVTVMMRVVFLLFAEERGLLPESSLFAGGYGISGELEALDARAREEGSEALDATQQTWHRLLATSQAIYRGASFEDLRLPAYGGSLFDPERFAWLTTRTERGTLAITVSDRVMLEVLRSVQVAQLKGQPARRISFRDIDVEQIGYIYEGLLGYSCEEVSEVTVGLQGTPGAEPEIPLSELESLRRRNRSDATLAEAIRDWVKNDQPAAKPQTKAQLAKGLGAEVEDAERALRAVTPDAALRERLRPFVGIIRRDLRQRPLVVPSGGLLVVETPSRATAGAHYTPRSLAEEVVKHALQPLVFEPGPHATPDEEAWRPISSDQILDLKIADIACGSGAFLVAAARYLAARLVEAWRREGVATGTPHELSIRAVREVVATCIYGSDINAMAVEMCKLSLWLVSLDPKLPFSFVDDKILHGNSLLGLTDERQLKRQHIDPDAASDQLDLLGLDVDGVLDKAVRLRRQLATEVNDDDPQRSATTKRRQWARYQELTAQLSDVADGVIAAGLRLGGKPGRELREAYENLPIALGRAYPADGGEPDRSMLDGILEAGLTPTVPTDYERWKPLHWILAVPDVMERGGFDAVVGNPPFVSGLDLNRAVGKNVREAVINWIADRRKGIADQSAYFFLRTFVLLPPMGNFALIATSTIAEGDTREVGLDPLLQQGVEIYRSKKSARWPGSSGVFYSAVWASRAKLHPAVKRVCDDKPVSGITSILEPASRADGPAIKLYENKGMAFNGCYVNGKGFELSEAVARDLLEKDKRNSAVLREYLTGSDLNDAPTARPSSWIIDFDNLTLNQAEEYAAPFKKVEKDVWPHRKNNSRKARRERWWQYAERQPSMRRTLESFDRCTAIRQSGQVQYPVLVDPKWVIDQTVIVFATADPDFVGIISSSPHQMWLLKYGLSIGKAPRYTPSDVFETFPRPTVTGRLTDVGDVLESERRGIMLRRHIGLTKLYNRVNDPDVADSADADVKRVREIHVELDHAVMDAYGWGDVPLEHGFHTYRQMRRWTVSPAARVEILDRLLAENHRRAAAQGEAPPPPEADEEGDEE